MLDAITSANCVAWQDSYIPPGGGDQCMNAEQPERAKIWSEHWRDVQRDENELDFGLSGRYAGWTTLSPVPPRNISTHAMDADAMMAIQRLLNIQNDPDITAFLASDPGDMYNNDTETRYNGNGRLAPDPDDMYSEFRRPIRSHYVRGLGYVLNYIS